MTAPQQGKQSGPERCLQGDALQLDSGDVLKIESDTLDEKGRAERKEDVK